MSQQQVKGFRILGKVFFVAYLLLLAYLLCFCEQLGRVASESTYRYNLEPFKEIMRFVECREELGMFALLANLVGNVVIFVPFGFFVSMASRVWRMRRAICYSLAVSLAVELLQLILRVGSFDVDDLLLNTIGGFLGFILFEICNRVRRIHYGSK